MNMHIMYPWDCVKLCTVIQTHHMRGKHSMCLSWYDTTLCMHVYAHVHVHVHMYTLWQGAMWARFTVNKIPTCTNVAIPLIQLCISTISAAQQGKGFPLHPHTQPIIAILCVPSTYAYRHVHYMYMYTYIVHIHAHMHVHARQDYTEEGRHPGTPPSQEFPDVHVHVLYFCTYTYMYMYR